MFKTGNSSIDYLLVVIIFLPLLPRNKKPRLLAGFSVSRIFPQAEGDQIGRQRP